MENLIDKKIKKLEKEKVEGLDEICRLAQLNILKELKLDFMRKEVTEIVIRQEWAV